VTLRVLVCGDSASDAAALVRALEHDRDITVSAVCKTATSAIAVLPRSRADLVIMSLETAGPSGLRAVEEIMSTRPLPILVISPPGRPKSGTTSALALGALAVIDRDDLDLRDPAAAPADAFRKRVRVLSRAPVIRHLRAELKAGAGPHDLGRRASVIGICASTGGPQLLARILSGLPPDYPVPLLVVQHIGAGFTARLADWLGQVVRLPVAVAHGGEQAGTGVWIAPERAHLTVTAAGLLSLSRFPSGDRHCPSGDALLASIATAARRLGVAVVLSGMGRDGAAGAAAVHRGGGLAIAQDEESSAVFGMPAAAIDEGVDCVLSPAGITATLLALRHEPFPVSR
jgi:two-component system, chemotaxis family, protein-glutamate methylesterase/glutaminase